MKHKKLKITIVLALQVLFLILIVGQLFWTYFNFLAQGYISSFADYMKIMVKNKTYISITLVILSFVGLFVKRNVGWIFTSLIFYTITIILLFIFKDLKFKLIELTTYIPVLSVLLYSDWLLNSTDILLYLKVNNDRKNIIKINVITISFSILIFIILFYTNIN